LNGNTVIEKIIGSLMPISPQDLEYPKEKFRSPPINKKGKFKGFDEEIFLLLEFMQIINSNRYHHRGRICGSS